MSSIMDEAIKKQQKGDWNEWHKGMGEAKVVYADIPIGKPFRILEPNKDATVWQKNEHGLVIYFHSENFWCNPPTDTNMEYNAQKAIGKYGVEYLREDYVDHYNKHQRAKDLEAAFERHRQSMWKNRHLHPWMKKPTKQNNIIGKE